jgi:hypothetical protein
LSVAACNGVGDEAVQRHKRTKVQPGLRFMACPAKPFTKRAHSDRNQAHPLRSAVHPGIVGATTTLHLPTGFGVRSSDTAACGGPKLSY